MQVVNVLRRRVLSTSALLALAACSLPVHAQQNIVQAEAVTKILPAFNAYVEDVRRRSGVPGIAIGIVADGKVVLARGFGVRDVGGKELVDADTVFPLASVSKPITGASVAVLVGEGAIGWDDPLSDYARGIRFQDGATTAGMTFRDVLAQRTGLPAFYGDELETQFHYSREEIFKRLRYLPPVTPFRSAYAYSNWNLTLAGEVAARSVGMNWEQMVQEKLFKPLGMTSTMTSSAQYLATPNRAVAHGVHEGQATAAKFVGREKQAPGGGVASNVNDMLRWMSFEIDGGVYAGRQIAATSAVRETQLPQVIVNPHFPDTEYGLGIEVRNDHGRKVISHAGAFEEGINTMVWMLPNEKLGVVVLTNGPPLGVPDALVNQLAYLVFADRSGEDLWPKYQKFWIHAVASLLNRPGRLIGDPPAQAAAAQAAERYVGTYVHPYYGAVQVAQDKGVLTLTPGKGQAHPLQHWTGDTFRAAAMENGAVSFVLRPGGSDALLISELTDVPNAVFTKQNKESK